MNTITKNELLKEKRLAAKLTQQQLANLVGINIRQIQKFESGDAPISGASLRIAIAIADTLSIDPHDLL